MNENKLKILQMVEDKTITVEEAMNLLSLLDRKENKKEYKNSKTETKNPPYQSEIIKVSDNEFEILQNVPETKTQKKGLFFKNRQNGESKKLVIRVEEKGKTVVNLRVPINFISPFIKGGIKIGRISSPEFHQYMSKISDEDLEQYINSGYTGTLIDIHDEKDGEHVYIGIE